MYPFRILRLHMSFCKVLLPVRNSLFNFSLIVKKTLQLCKCHFYQISYLGSTILFTIVFVSAWIHIVTFKFYESNQDKKPITFFDAFFFTTSKTASFYFSDVG